MASIPKTVKCRPLDGNTYMLTAAVFVSQLETPPSLLPRSVDLLTTATGLVVGFLQPPPAPPPVKA